MKTLNTQRLLENVRRAAEYDLSENNVTGSAYKVMQNGEALLEEYFGYTDISESNRVSADTVYRLASMTKPVTAAAVLILVDRGLLSLDAKAKDFYPRLEDIHIITGDGEDLGISKTDITVMHLLTHTSGFGSIKSPRIKEADKATIDGTVNYYISEGLDFEPFTRQAYSAYAAFDVVAGIIEKITDRDYGEFLQTEIFSPCGMTDTTFSPSYEQESRIITMHNKRDGKSCVGKTHPGCIFESFPYSHKLAGAGLASTLTDYSKFAEMLLRNGKTENRRVLSEGTARLMGVPFVPKEIMPGRERWGLGVRVVTEEYETGIQVGSFGWSGAYGSHFWVDPVNGITAVFMKNSRFDGGASNRSACRFEEAVYSALEE